MSSRTATPTELSLLGSPLEQSPIECPHAEVGSHFWHAMAPRARPCDQRVLARCALCAFALASVLPSLVIAAPATASARPEAFLRDDGHGTAVAAMVEALIAASLEPVLAENAALVAAVTELSSQVRTLEGRLDDTVRMLEERSDKRPEARSAGGGSSGGGVGRGLLLDAEGGGSMGPTHVDEASLTTSFINVSFRSAC